MIECLDQLSQSVTRPQSGFTPETRMRGARATVRIKRARFITWIVIAAVGIYAVTSLVSLRSQMLEMERRRDELAAEAETLSRKNAEYRYEIEHSNDHKTIENVARNRLGLVMPGEKVFYDIGAAN